MKNIKEIISEQTGYTTDLLDDNLDLEADLGIDTVKQVEIFGKVSAKFNLQGKTYNSVKYALNAARQAAGTGDLVMVGGSAFVVAEVI